MTSILFLAAKKRVPICRWSIDVCSLLYDYFVQFTYGKLTFNGKRECAIMNITMSCRDLGVLFKKEIAVQSSKEDNTLRNRPSLSLSCRWS